MYSWTDDVELEHVFKQMDEMTRELAAVWPPYLRGVMVRAVLSLSQHLCTNDKTTRSAQRSSLHPGTAVITQNPTECFKLWGSF